MSQSPTLADQAAFVYALVDRTRMQFDIIADETWLRLTKDEAEALEALAKRLDRMAPKEGAIRRVVVGKQ